MQQYDEEKKKRRPIDNKDQYCEIKSGLTFEALYKFKLKPDLQACLFTRSHTTADKNSSDGSEQGMKLNACSIFREKLVVVVLKRMNMRSTAAMTEPTTSAYFEDMEKVEMKETCVPNNTICQKRKLQNIIDRSGPKLSKRAAKSKKGGKMSDSNDKATSSACSSDLSSAATTSSVLGGSLKMKNRNGVANIFESLSKNITSSVDDLKGDRTDCNQLKPLKNTKRKVDKDCAPVTKPKKMKPLTEETNNNVMTHNNQSPANEADDILAIDELPDILSTKSQRSKVNSIKSEPKRTIPSSNFSCQKNTSSKKSVASTAEMQHNNEVSDMSRRSIERSCETMLEEDDLPFIAPPKPRRKSVVKEIRKSLSRSNAECVREEDLCTIIEDLSSPEVITIEPDRVDEMMMHIRAVKEVSQLEAQQISYLVTKNEQYLRSIFQGKIKCRRHEDYKNGGKDRRNLTYQVPVTLYSEDQGDCIMEQLLHMFCQTHMKYMDYVFRVLFPEILVKIYMEVHQTSHELAEERMADALVAASQCSDDDT
ncbi:uncharacterized protein LOC141911569 [Tubulanus polymorphus]|uniref:uncharacterized protein LOC141911569 n=1 Tax=Tubulanus polymorphus TaxID=672921 RepID=UPI003DA43C79